MDGRAFDRLKKISTFPVVAARCLGKVLKMLCFEIGLDESAKGARLRCLGLLRLGNGSDRFTLSKEFGRILC